MNEKYGLEKSKRKSSGVTYSYHLHVEVFYVVIDLQLSDLNNHFSEVNTDLLLGMDSLSSENNFTNYDKEKIMNLATYYPNEFSASKLEDLSFDLDNYIYYVREVDNAFSNLKELGYLSIKLVETNMCKTWKLVYLLVKLSLILLIATAIEERAFSSMMFIKNDLRNRIGDDFLNDCLICYIEDEVFNGVPNDAIIDRFQNMTTRQIQLFRCSVSAVIVISVCLVYIPQLKIPPQRVNAGRNNNEQPHSVDLLNETMSHAEFWETFQALAQEITANVQANNQATVLHQ
ncbi:uncharacterized protein LOC107858720 [Capsicum annuum]|uniref:uncharacterized protein LOC107858720 n=1 Tax=Capsicum annuum TaxID=4072 RepID=UPI001FB1A112|nr:uncharacterized protein LOC107858720 [Capsicum annuum]